MLTLQQIKEKIEVGLPGAQVEILDPRKDGIHLKAIVTYDGFQGKSLIEQHQMVYDTLKEELKEELHALALETRSTSEQVSEKGERELKKDKNPIFNRIRELINSSKVFFCVFSLSILLSFNSISFINRAAGDVSLSAIVFHQNL